MLSIFGQNADLLKIGSKLYQQSMSSTESMMPTTDGDDVGCGVVAAPSSLPSLPANDNVGGTTTIKIINKNRFDAAGRFMFCEPVQRIIDTHSQSTLTSVPCKPLLIGGVPPMRGPSKGLALEPLPLYAALLRSPPPSRLAAVTLAWKQEKENKLAKLKQMRAAREMRAKDREMRKVQRLASK